MQAASAAATVPVLLPAIIASKSSMIQLFVCWVNFVYCILGFCSWCPRTKRKHQSVVITCRAFVWPGKPLAGHDSVAIPPTSPTSWLERWWRQSSSLWLAGWLAGWRLWITTPATFATPRMSLHRHKPPAHKPLLLLPLRHRPHLTGGDTWFWVRV